MEGNRESRRAFLRRAAMTGPAGSIGKAMAASFQNEIGFQLYTLRSLFAGTPEKAFQALARVGYRKAEVLRAGLDRMAPLLRASGLKLVSGHFDAPLLTGNWEAWAKWPNYTKPPDGYDWNRAIEQAQALGIKFMVIPFLVPGERGGEDAYKRIAERLNRGGDACRAAGLHLCYHHHAFEFQPIGRTTPLEVLMRSCDSKLVGLEVDVFWASVAGVEPVDLLLRYRGRVPLIHIKDKAKGTAQSYVEQKVPAEAFKEVGTGMLDIPAILREAARAGIEHYFVEQDQCPGDPVASLAVSYNNLRRVSL